MLYTMARMILFIIQIMQAVSLGGGGIWKRLRLKIGKGTTMPSAPWEHDHAGHFISAQDGGDPGKINLSAQEEHVNTRDYRAFERENHALVEQGYYVELIGEVSYPMGSDVNRPEAYMVERIATNEKGEEIDHSYFSFTNENMAEFELIGEEEASEQQFELVNPSEVVCDQEQNIITDSETGAIISDSVEISTEETSDVETTGSEEVEADVNVETETEAETL